MLLSNPWNSKSQKDNCSVQLSSSVFGEYSSWLKIAAYWQWLFPGYFCSSFKIEEAFQYRVCVCIHIYTCMWRESGSVVSYSAFPWAVIHQASLSHGITQAGILEWVAIPFSRGASWPRNWTWVSLIAGRFFTIWATAAAAAKSPQSCPTLCDPIDGSPPGFPCWDSPGKNPGVGCHFLLQYMKVKGESEVAQLCLTLSHPWTAAYQAPPSMGFSRQEYWSGVPLSSPLSHRGNPIYIYTYI